MYEFIEVTVRMLHRLSFDAEDRIDFSGIKFGRRYHVVERMTYPDGGYDITIVNSVDTASAAIAEVYFRHDYCRDYGKGATSDYEVWHVNEYRYYFYSEGYSFGEYVEVLPQWLYCVEDWDGTRLYSLDAEDFDANVQWYGCDATLSGPMVCARKLRYTDSLGGIELEGYFPVVTVKVL